MAAAQPQLPLALLPLFFVGMWLLVSAQISRSGWRAFVERYPAGSRPAGKAHTSSSTRFAGLMSRYNNVVRVVFTEAGVYFFVIFLFRPFHPPFLVPWRSVRRVEKRRGLFVHSYQLDIEDAAGEIHVTLPLSAEPDLLRYQKPF